MSFCGVSIDFFVPLGCLWGLTWLLLLGFGGVFGGFFFIGLLRCIIPVSIAALLYGFGWVLDVFSVIVGSFLVVFVGFGGVLGGFLLGSLLSTSWRHTLFQ